MTDINKFKLFENYYAVIMAGGSGTRLWPLSRKKRPKQMLPLIGDDSMFRVSVMRLQPLFPPERVFVVTGASQVEALKADVPELPEENFIIEPSGKNSGPAAGLGVAHIACLNPEAVIAILTADHHIADVAGFRTSLQTAYAVASQGYIVTLGIQPTYPATGFGYIHSGDMLSEEILKADGHGPALKIYHSKGFREKPDSDTAEKFLQAGTYYWNSGMFIWKATRAMAAFKQQSPDIYNHLQAIQEASGTSDYKTRIEQAWGEMPSISLDYAVMEKATRMAVIPVSIGWSDIGSWAAVYEEQLKIRAEESENNIFMGKGHHIPLDTGSSLIYSQKAVVTIGLEDLIIVDTDDVLLICKKGAAQEVRRAVKEIEERGLDSLL